MSSTGQGASTAPLRDHEIRVSKLVPPGTAYVIDEEVMRV